MWGKWSGGGFLVWLVGLVSSVSWGLSEIPWMSGNIADGKLTLARFERLIEIAAQELEGKAFRFFADARDFNHGHVVLEKIGNTLYPRAILYHTQEDAFDSYWLLDDQTYTYLDQTARNWIQWLDEDPDLDGRTIVNARDYLDPEVQRREPYFDTVRLPEPGHHYTIHTQHLDSRLLKFNSYGMFQFMFAPAGCHEKFDSWGESGPLTIRIAKDRVVCIKLTGTHMITENKIFSKRSVGEATPPVMAQAPAAPSGR